MDISIAAYRRLAEFRHQIRQFLHVSEQAARANGIEPQQHQLMLAIKGLPEGARPTVTMLSLRLCLKHHSAVELVNRLVERGAAVRRPSQEDRREVLVELTPLGEEILEKLEDLHLQELRTKAPELWQALKTVVEGSQLDAAKAGMSAAHS